VPAWFTTRFCPATVRVALRAAALPLAAAVNPMVAAPLPDVAPSPSQLALLEATQLHPAPLAEIVTVPPPAPEPSTRLLELRLKLHGTPACVTWNVCPPISAEAVLDTVVEFGATASVTVPLPLGGGAGAESEIQDGPVSVLHPHRAGAVIPTDTCPPAEETDVPGSESEYVQLAPAWFTACVWPFTLIAPDRLPGFALACTENASGPDPMPEPLAIWIHESAVVAFHGQAADDAFTVACPEPPPAGTADAAGDIVKAQLMPNCVMVWTSPCTTTVPVRGVGAVFAAAVKFTVPFPVPLPGDCTVIHESGDAADELHVEAVVTFTLPSPPPAGAVPLADPSE
jgi:hypothetical protein